MKTISSTHQDALDPDALPSDQGAFRSYLYLYRIAPRVMLLAKPLYFRPKLGTQ
jgi:hypothetical protein